MSEEIKHKKKWPKVLLILLLLIAAFAGFLSYHAMQNNRVMYDTIANGLQIVEDHYTVKQLDAGEYSDMRFYGLMKFHTDQYQVEGLGNLSVMRANMGFMQMVSFMITPFEKDVPLCTLDYMYILGNRKSYVEFYDLVGDTQTAEYQGVLDALRSMTARYDQAENLEVSEHWYDSLLSVAMHKQLKKSEDTLNQEMFYDALRTYLDESSKLESSTPEQAKAQHDATKAYSDGLIEKGGVSTDVFKKALGEEKTRDFFDSVFFGSAVFENASGAQK